MRAISIHNIARKTDHVLLQTRFFGESPVQLRDAQLIDLLTVAVDHLLEKISAASAPADDRTEAQPPRDTTEVSVPDEETEASEEVAQASDDVTEALDDKPAADAREEKATVRTLVEQSFRAPKPDIGSDTVLDQSDGRGRPRSVPADPVPSLDSPMKLVIAARWTRRFRRMTFGTHRPGRHWRRIARSPTWGGGATMGQAREVMDRLTMLAVEERDLASAVDCYAEDAVVVTPDAGDVRGRDHIAEYWSQFVDAFPDSHYEHVGRYEAGGTAIDEGYYTGTQLAPMTTPSGETIPATGKRVRLRSCDVATVVDGQIVEHHVYFDQADLLNQLGIAP